MRRFFIKENDISGANVVISERDDVHHIARVLRLSPGNEIDLSDGVRWEYRAEILAVEKDAVRVRILDKQAFAREPSLAVTLFQGVPKQGKMEEIIRKLTELGGHGLVPVYTQRSVPVEKSAGKKEERWQRIADEAVKQCRRGIIPIVEHAITFSDMIACFEYGDSLYDLVLFPYENEKGRTIKDVLRNLPEKPKYAALIIGPEGGFSDEEAKMLTEAGALSVSLGKTILRTETAGPAALAMIMYELEM